MLLEGKVVRLHGAFVQALPDLAPDLLRKAGLGTAEYILANRIPAPAKRVIRILPNPWGARLLARSIAKHGWTFAGSGQFRHDGYGRFAFRLPKTRWRWGRGGTQAATGTRRCSKGCSQVSSGQRCSCARPPVVRPVTMPAGLRSPRKSRLDRLNNVMFS